MTSLPEKEQERKWGSGGEPPIPPRAELEALVRRALAEDIGSGDVTTDATVAPDARARGLISQKADGSVYGLELAELTFLALDPDARFQRLVREGYWRAEGGPVLEVEGLARALLTAERTALNFLGHLSGVSHVRRARGQRGEWHRREGARHAQDDPGAARAGEGRRGGRWRAQPPLRAV